MFFANAPEFSEEVYERAQHATSQASVIEVDAEEITDIDATAIMVMSAPHEKLAGVELGFASVRPPIMEVMRNFGLRILSVQSNSTCLCSLASTTS